MNANPPSSEGDVARNRLAQRFLTRQLLVVGAVAVGLIAVAAAVLWVAFKSTANVQLLPLTFLAGCLGGAINHYRRLAAIKPERLALPPDHDQWASLLKSPIMVHAFVSPLIGGVFAVVAYMIFAAGVLNGPLFPVFDHADSPYEGLKSLFELLRPVSLADAAKAVFWGFVSGFCEKFIPNMLDRMSKDASAE